MRVFVNGLGWSCRKLGLGHTIHDNIAYGNPKASREEVVAAAKAANADFFIKQLPQGYDTFLKDAGQSLSQGQRQLLTIAHICQCA